MFIASVTSCLGCLGLPAGASFPLKCMEIEAAFDHPLLPCVGEFPNHLQTDLKFWNRAIRRSLFEPHGTNCN